LDRFSNQYKKNLTAKRTLSNDEITNAYAELFFHLKKTDSSQENLPLVEFVGANCFEIHLTLERQHTVFMSQLRMRTPVFTPSPIFMARKSIYIAQ